MLVAQAAKAVEHFLDVTLAEDTLDRVYNKMASAKENIVLTGMPASGKTTVGKMIAQQLNRPFVDMDDEIIKEIGCSISDYFEKFGETAFRDVESKVAREVVASKVGCVIATGGGAVLRDENVFNLKLNGKLYFIDRPLEQLCATDDRPTASSKEALEKRYYERYDRYQHTCDVHIHSDGVAAQVAEQIVKEHKK
jgi:shikimate dehydrogenase